MITHEKMRPRRVYTDWGDEHLMDRRSLQARFRCLVRHRNVLRADVIS